MPADARRPTYRKKPNRLAGYDYRQPGCYFVTLCTEHRAPLFGRIDNGRMLSSPAGIMVIDEWQRLPETFPGLALDAWMLMPDHLHAIVLLGTDPSKTTAPRLGDIIRAYKGVTSQRYFRNVRAGEWPPVDGRVWQLRYHDRIVRNDRELQRIRDYIAGNPMRWEQRHHP